MSRTSAPTAFSFLFVLVAAAVTSCNSGTNGTAPSAMSSTATVARPPSPSGASTSAEDLPSVAEFTVAKSSVDGPRRLTARVGDLIVFSVISDSADEVHVHGYNVTVPVRPGRPAMVRVRADVPGVFAVELEHGHEVITQLHVRP